MFQVIVTSPAIPGDVASWLGKDVATQVLSSATRADLEVALKAADGLVCLLSERIDEELLSKAPKLKVIANYAVGYDNIDVQAATRRGIVVTNTPDVLTEATADLAFALLLATARRIVEGDALVRLGKWRGWAPDLLLGMDVWGQTLGIIGLGRIGQAMARRGHGFAMPVLYTARRAASPDIEASLGATRVSLEDLLRQADFVSLHCPLNAETRGVIGRHELSLMKKTAILVNTARGRCIDENALADALESGLLAGAGLDVFAEEPTVPARLLCSPRAVLAPHLGSATITARSRMAEICANATRIVLEGGRPTNTVNPEVFG
ncbi:MAG: D-glycerate dehydrogenase [Pseudomonadota bacterium]